MPDTLTGTSAVLAAAASAMAEQPKHVFYDMVHSNNAARIRLWLALKEGAAAHVETYVLRRPTPVVGVRGDCAAI